MITIAEVRTIRESTAMITTLSLIMLKILKEMIKINQGDCSSNALSLQFSRPSSIFDKHVELVSPFETRHPHPHSKIIRHGNPFGQIAALRQGGDLGEPPDPPERGATASARAAGNTERHTTKLTNIIHQIAQPSNHIFVYKGQWI